MTRLQQLQREVANINHEIPSYALVYECPAEGETRIVYGGNNAQLSFLLQIFQIFLSQHISSSNEPQRFMDWDKLTPT